MNWYTIVSTIAIPLIVTGLRAAKLPAKWAPVTAFGVAIILTAIGQALGLTLDVNTIAQTILQSLGIAGVAVLGYDQVKKLTETK
jgi:hypothetical protein